MPCGHLTGPQSAAHFSGHSRRGDIWTMTSLTTAMSGTAMSSNSNVQQQQCPAEMTSGSWSAELQPTQASERTVGIGIELASILAQKTHNSWSHYLETFSTNYKHICEKAIGQRWNLITEGCMYIAIHSQHE